MLRYAAICCNKVLSEIYEMMLDNIFKYEPQIMYHFTSLNFDVILRADENELLIK